ncbi:GMP synthase (glutamine-hydrolyzing) [Bradyrhizobium sp. USDA 4011]
MTRTVVAIRHLAFEDLGAFEDVFRQSGLDVRYVDAGIDDLSSLDPGDDDIAVILGGPIGAYDDSKYPFLKVEADYIERRLGHKRATLGICLGAQLMARSLGARVYPANDKEIGFFPVDMTRDGNRSCLASLLGEPVLHWHGDTFDLPSGAVRLASTQICENQAFSFGDNAIAFQFHPELGSVGFERWLIGHTCELAVVGIDVCKLRREYKSLRFKLEARARACLRLWLNEIEMIPQNAAR